MPAESAAIELRRVAGKWADRRRAYRVIVDGGEVGRLGNGESASFEVAPGSHELHLKIDWCRSERLALDLAPGETAVIECEARNPWQALYWVSFGCRRYVKLTRLS